MKQTRFREKNQSYLNTNDTELEIHELLKKSKINRIKFNRNKLKTSSFLCKTMVSPRRRIRILDWIKN